MYSSLLRVKTLKFALKSCNIIKRNLSKIKRGIILGIETSCDDTGAAVVNSDGKVLGEALNSQHLVHLK